MEIVRGYNNIKYRISDDKNYIMHFNKNHSPKNGQFTSGDGDADGIVNDHENQNKELSKKVGWTTRLNIRTLRRKYGLDVDELKRGDKLTVGDAKKILKTTDTMLENNTDIYDDKWIREIRVDMLDRLMTDNKQKYSEQYIREYNDYKTSAIRLDNYMTKERIKAAAAGVLTAAFLSKFA